MDTAALHFHARQLKAADRASYCECRAVAGEKVGVEVRMLAALNIHCPDMATAQAIQSAIDAAIKAAIAPIIAHHQAEAQKAMGA